MQNIIKHSGTKVVDCTELHRFESKSGCSCAEYRVILKDYEWVLAAVLSINTEKREDLQHPESPRYMTTVYGFIDDLSNSGAREVLREIKRYGHYSLVSDPEKELKKLVHDTVDELTNFLLSYSSWKEHLIYCPSECFREVGNRTLYMRWRGGDPWTFSVVKNIDGPDGGRWYDIPDAPGFEHDRYEDAEGWFDKWYETNGCDVKFEY